MEKCVLPAVPDRMIVSGGLDVCECVNALFSTPVVVPCEKTLPLDVGPCLAFKCIWGFLTDSIIMLLIILLY